MSNCDQPALSRQIHLGNTVVIVDGLARTGKGMIGTILSSFARVEIERLEEDFESASTLYQMQKITRDAAITLLRIGADNHLINSFAGRNTNFRFADQSSVWKAPDPLRYFRRILIRDKDSVLEKIKKERPIFQNQTHAQLVNFDLYHEAYGDRLRFIEIIRHPIDVVDAWMRRSFGVRFGEDPLQLSFCVSYKGRDLPYWTVGWEDTYLSATPLERVIRMIELQLNQNQRAYDSLTETLKKQLFVVPFEDFVQRPKPYLHALAQFVGSEVTRHTRGILRRENCPRTLLVSDMERKQKSLEERVSKQDRLVLHRLIEDYEALAIKFAR